VDDPERERQLHPPIEETRDLGIMLYDLDYTNPESPEPLFFRAQMNQGTITIPQFNSSEILR
jgi:CRISPR-associated protein Cas5d